jgi:threonine synthase
VAGSVYFEAWARVSSFLTHLECSGCGEEYDAERLQTVCRHCGKVLFARYDLDRARSSLTRDGLTGRVASLWRYAELLPVRDSRNRISLGEGWTPLLAARRLGGAVDCPRLLVKDEGVNPTGSFKARGMSVAVSRALELGARALATPSAGNAGSAMSAYAACAGLASFVFMPEDAPAANQSLAMAYGANLFRVRGLISDCGRVVRRESANRDWFDLSTLREPYRAEGKKTMGFELAEQLDWRLPDVIVYPTGGGTGIVGMWKAFDELEQLGWIGSRRPRMISVQSAGCAPIVRAFQEGKDSAEPWPNASTVAAGLRVPAAIGDYLILRALRESGGTAVAVADEEIVKAVELVARREGLFVSTEAGATIAGLRRLILAGEIDPGSEIVLFLTGSGLLNPDPGPVDRPTIEPDDSEALAAALADDTRLSR